MREAFLADQPASLGPGVTSDKIGYELDWYMDWTINDHFTASFVAAAVVLPVCYAIQSRKSGPPAVPLNIIGDFAAMSGVELAGIGADTTFSGFERELRWNQAYHHLVTGP